MNTLDRLETTLRVRGGSQLEGSIATHGAKNAALPIMAAALLAKGKVTLHRVPRITDVSSCGRCSKRSARVCATKAKTA